MGWCGSIKIVRTPASNFFTSSGRPKTWKMVFFRVSHIYGKFWSRRPYMGSSMWKLTSWRIGKCDGFPCSDVLNPSYGWSKSTESEILSLSSKIVGVQKKRHGFNKPFWDLKWIGYQTYHVRTLFYSYDDPQCNIEAVSFFCDVAYFRWQVENFRLCWLWAAVTPVQKLENPISPTFLKSPGRQLSHGATHIGSTASEWPVIVGNTKKYIFWCFWVSAVSENVWWC